MEIVGYTNYTLKEMLLSSGMDMCDLEFCNVRRHRSCRKEQKCFREKPQCEIAEFHMIGKKYNYYGTTSFTAKNRQKLEDILRQLFLKCREIHITVRSCIRYK